MCSKCKVEEEDQRHLLICLKTCKKMTLCSKSIDYDADDFHGSEFDTSKLEVIGKVLMDKSQMLLSDNVNIITPLCTLFCLKKNSVLLAGKHRSCQFLEFLWFLININFRKLVFISVPI